MTNKRWETREFDISENQLNNLNVLTRACNYNPYIARLHGTQATHYYAGIVVTY